MSRLTPTINPDERNISQTLVKDRAQGARECAIRKRSTKRTNSRWTKIRGSLPSRQLIERIYDEGERRSVCALSRGM